MSKTQLELKKEKLKNELMFAESDLQGKQYYCQNCSEKTSNAQYTTQGTYVLTVVSCRYGYRETKEYNRITGKSSIPPHECPKFKGTYDKIDRLKEEIKKLDSAIIQSQKQKEIENQKQKEAETQKQQKIVETSKPKKVISVNTTAEALTERGYIFLEDSYLMS